MHWPFGVMETDMLPVTVLANQTMFKMTEMTASCITVV